MKVLLIAPLDPIQPINHRHLMGGENTYTRLLLSNPPIGIEFVHIEDALRSGMVQKHVGQEILLLLQKFRILPPGPRTYVIRVLSKFDLIYAHGYPVKLIRTQLPLIISDSSSNFIFLKYYMQIPHVLFLFWKFTKKITYTILGIIDGEINTQKSRYLFVFSNWAKKLKAKEFGIKNINTVSPGVYAPPIFKRNYRKKGQIKLLFVGVWFERKGGTIVLNAFRNLARKYSDISLTIVGELPRSITIDPSENVRNFHFVSHQKLRELYMTHDVLVHIPPLVEGYGMSVIEAMSYGVVPIVSRICALPELVDHLRNGLVISPGSQKMLENTLIKLLDQPHLLKKLSRGAREKYNQQFSLEKFQKKLRLLFQKSISN